MGDGAYGRYGIARVYALIFGITYLAVAAVELITRDALAPVLEFTALQNAVHWAVGAVVLLSFFGGETAARLVARIVGVVFVALTLWGVVAPDSLGAFLGYAGGIPVSYNIVHALTAAVALYAGFASRAPSRATA
ncbi:MAG TPA: DUF4383 domain-containing protein [Actinomycetota bacterium]|jgi:hypothetical protein|nr:DUF4383 domain-containing protein [Actinomycetota bacterium]